MKEDIAKLFEEVLGVKTVMVNAENSKIASILNKELRKVATFKMIADAESIAKDITSGNIEDLNVDVRNVGVILANVILFDNEDANLVGIDGIKRLAKAFDKSLTQFNKIAAEHIKRLNNMISDLQHDDEPSNGAGNDIDEDLTKLTKEELIARLREKSK